MSPFDVALFAAAVRLAVPLALAALGELFSERAGVINIGLEGMMLTGAYAGFLTAYATGDVLLGVLAGAVAGIAVGALVAAMSVNLGGDQIVVGVAVNLLAAGLTLFLYRWQFQGAQPTTDRMQAWPVPVLSDIPVLGPILFRQLPLVYIAYLAVPVAAYLLYRTRSGLLLRATGETPEAVAAAGAPVLRIQWVGVLTAGGLAGLAGAFLSVGQVGLFAEDMVSGRGFLALAAVAFGRWRPVGVAAACLVFGFTDALQLRLQSMPSVPRSVWVVLLATGVLLLTAAAVVTVRRGRGRRAGAGTPVRRAPGYLLTATVVLLVGAGGVAVVPDLQLPSQFWLALPSLLSLLALAGTSRGARAPALLGRSVRSTLG
ncbi:MAG TPA: ABC transporter permease [Cellulomonas sp.]